MASDFGGLEFDAFLGDATDDALADTASRICWAAPTTSATWDGDAATAGGPSDGAAVANSATSADDAVGNAAGSTASSGGTGSSGGVTGIATPVLPMVSIRVTKAVVSEEVGEVDPTRPDSLFVISLDQPFSQPVTVVIKDEAQMGLISGEGFATAGVDYVSLPQRVTIQPGRTDAVVPLFVLNDRKVEQSETVRLVIDASADYDVSPTAGFASVRIDDNDYWAWDRQEIADHPFDKTARLSAWDLPIPLPSLLVGDPLGKGTTEGKIHVAQPGHGVAANLDALFHGWGVNRLGFPSAIDARASQNLWLGFDFDPITGKVFPLSGSGVGVSQHDGAFASNRELSVALGYSFTVDNSSDEVHRVTVTVDAVAGVDGQITVTTAGQVGFDGKVKADLAAGDSGRIGIERGMTGSLSVSFTETSDKSYRLLDDHWSYNLVLRVQERTTR
ncbi:MAG TPA: hypothetical protein PLV92_07150 [Pirellulaceae bacterium]|nr:hypothetical protein [Pirellulaceae bacterium]